MKASPKKLAIKAKKKPKKKKPIRQLAPLSTLPYIPIESSKALPFAYAREYKAYQKIIDNHCNHRVCKRWLKGEKDLNGFACFLSDMGAMQFNRYKLSLIENEKDYEPENCQWISAKPNTKSVLSFDPGTINFAACHSLNDKVQTSYMVNFSLPHIKDQSFDSDVQRYTNGLVTLFNKTQPTAVIIERFVPRRFGTGSTEVINIMIGILIGFCRARCIPIQVVMSSTWKNKIEQFFDLDTLYKKARFMGAKLAHPIDAALIGHYLVLGENFDDKTYRWIIQNMDACKAV